MDTQFIKVSPEDENVPHRRLTASPAGPGICSCSTPSCSFWRSCCPPPSGKAWRSCGRWDGTTRNCLWIIRRGKKGEKDERERCVIMKTTSDLSKRIKKTKTQSSLCGDGNTTADGGRGRRGEAGEEGRLTLGRKCRRVHLRMRSRWRGPRRRWRGLRRWTCDAGWRTGCRASPRSQRDSSSSQWESRAGTHKWD